MVLACLTAGRDNCNISESKVNDQGTSHRAAEEKKIGKKKNEGRMSACFLKGKQSVLVVQSSMIDYEVHSKQLLFVGSHEFFSSSSNQPGCLQLQTHC